MGDVYTKIQNSSGAVLKLTAPLDALSLEQRRNMLKDRLREAFTALPKPAKIAG